VNEYLFSFSQKKVFNEHIKLILLFILSHN